MPIPHEDHINRMTPTTKRVALGTLIEEMITQHNALLAKLDADTGVTDEDYVATLSIVSLSAR